MKGILYLTWYFWFWTFLFDSFLMLSSLHILSLYSFMLSNFYPVGTLNILKISILIPPIWWFQDLCYLYQVQMFALLFQTILSFSMCCSFFWKPCLMYWEIGIKAISPFISRIYANMSRSWAVFNIYSSVAVKDFSLL